MTNTLKPNPNSRPRRKRGKRGKSSTRILDLPPRQHDEFRRACSLRGLSQSQALRRLTHNFTAEAKREYGNLFKSLTDDELRVRLAVEYGANAMDDLVEEARLQYAVVREIVDELVRRGELIECTFPHRAGEAGRDGHGYFLPDDVRKPKIY